MANNVVGGTAGHEVEGIVGVVEAGDDVVHEAAVGDIGTAEGGGSDVGTLGSHQLDGVEEHVNPLTGNDVEGRVLLVGSTVVLADHHVVGYKGMDCGSAVHAADTKSLCAVGGVYLV